jgi:hypothetical protein
MFDEMKFFTNNFKRENFLLKDKEIDNSSLSCNNIHLEPYTNTCDYSFGKIGEDKLTYLVDEETNKETNNTFKNTPETINRGSICDNSHTCSFPGNNSKVSYDKKKLFELLKTKIISKRKLQSDTIRNKIMSNFLNISTRRKLNEMISIEYFNFVKLQKINQQFMTKIDGETMRNILDKTLFQIFLQNSNSHNLKVIFNMMKINPFFSHFMNMTLEEAFEKYIGSYSYFSDLKKLKTRETKDYVQAYEKEISNFICCIKSKVPNERKNSKDI